MYDDDFTFGEIELRPTLNADAKYGYRALAMVERPTRESIAQYLLTMREVLDFGDVSPDDIDTRSLEDLRHYASRVSNSMTYIVGAVNDILDAHRSL